MRSRGKPPAARPRVSANFAVTWDGKITTRDRTPSGFTSPADKRQLIDLRAPADALLVGRATAEADRMSMRLPDPALRAARVARGQPPEPLRVILSAGGRIAPDLPLFRPGGAPVVIYTTDRMPGATRRLLAPLAEVVVLPEKSGGIVRGMLRDLSARLGVRHLHCEGGATLMRSLAEVGALDELHLTLCPLLFGGAAAPSLTGAAGPFLPRSLRWRLEECRAEGGECFLRYTRSGRR